MLIEQVIRVMGYPGIALLMFIENLFPPIPSEVIMPFAGFLVNEGEMSFAGIMIAGTIGAGAGAFVIYYIGRKLSEDRLRKWINKYGKYLLLSPKELDSALGTFHDHGHIMVFAGRLIPTIRSLISIPAGLEKMNISIFLLLTLVGTTLWNLALTGGGVYLGRNWERILGWIDTYSAIIYAILGVLLLVYAAQQIRKRV